MTHSKVHLEQMMREFIEEAERYDLEPKPASLWWSCTCADDTREDMMIKTAYGYAQVSLRNSF